MPAQHNLVLATVLLATGAWTLGCGGGGAGSVAPSSSPPPSNSSSAAIEVQVTPNSGTVLLGGTLVFTATVSNSANSAVTWSVDGIPGGSSQVGLISGDGVYTASADLPQGGTVQVTATSNADSSKTATARVTVSSDVSVSLAPSTANVELGATQTFHASIASSGRPDVAVRWSVSGNACALSCGTIDANGNYTAPRILPNSADLRVTATSVADPSKQSSANVVITSSFGLQLSAPASVQPSATIPLVATVTPAPSSDPSAALSWSVAGSGCAGAGCGTLSVVTTQSSGGSSFSSAANYTAPANVIQPNTVTVTVTAVADPSKKAQAVIAIQPPGSLTLSPPTATLAANHRITLTAIGNSPGSASLNWSVNGIPGGSAALGQLCVTGSNPCQNVSTAGSQVDYIAPGAIPPANPVAVSVTYNGNPYAPPATQITVINHAIVSVLPGNATLPPFGLQAFTASVLGTSSQAVIWQIQGAGCAGGACGSITSAGLYTAPSAPPSPNALQIIATSQDDTSQSAQANVTISSAANINGLHPASVYAGGANGFTLRVDGSGFVPSNPGPGSTLWIGGTARFTTCDSANSCSAAVTSADVAQAGSLSIQVRNPDSSTSNAKQLVIVALGNSEGVIELTSTAPKISGRNITVVEPTTAGIDTTQTNLDLEVAAIGSFVTSTNTCNLEGNPIVLHRPASGTSVADICLFSPAGFDTSMTYTISGPGDIAVISKQPAGLGIIHITLEIPTSAALGARTLFIQSANLDRTAASGVLEIY